MDVLREVVLAAAAITTGLLAGLYFAFSCSVMLALRQMDDVTFVDAMQRINRVIVNGWFMISFLGSPLLSVVAAVLYLGEEPSVLLWVVAAAVLNVISFLITVIANVPLNNALEAAGAPVNAAQAAEGRGRFEAPWVRWNLVRTVASTAGLGCIVFALAQ